MRIWTFTVPGQPHGKGRPRFTSRGRFPRAYTDARTRAYEAEIGLSAKAAGVKMIDGPVGISIVAIRAIPKGTSKRARAEMEASPCEVKPDLDNILKCVKDGLNWVAYRDDSAVCSVTAEKIWGSEPMLHVTVFSVGDNSEL